MMYPEVASPSLIRKRALVTGASGFIGSHLMHRLPQVGIEVDFLSRYLVHNLDSLKTYLERYHFDYIFHLASYGNHYHQRNARETVNTNILGTFNLLEATRHINYDAFVNFSSSSVLLPQQTWYSSAKAAGELLVQTFSEMNNKPAFSVRPSSVYGEGEADFRFIPKVIHSLLKDESMGVDLSPKHDWIYIDSFLSGLFVALDNVKQIQGLALNISSGKQHSNLEVIQILENIHGAKLKDNIFDNPRPYDTDNWNVDNSLLKSLGWRNNVTLRKGLKNTYEWYKEEYEKQTD